MNKIYIYQIWFPTSNKSYIGMTQDIKKRMENHLYVNSLVGKALRKYDDWQIYILHTVKNRDIASLIEIEEIRNFNSIVPNGYNLTRGGEGFSKPHSKETKKKIRQAKLGKKTGPLSEEHKKKLSVALKDRKLTKETRAKMSIAHIGIKGKHHSEEAKEKIRQARLGMKFTKEHKANLRASHLGKPSGMKGKHHTKEAKAKISAINKGKKLSKETKIKISISRRKG